MPCCCVVEWSLTDFILPPTPWTVVLESADPTLAPTITPTVLEVIDPFSPLVFTLCVDPDHTIGDTVDIVVRDANGVEFSRAPVQYTVQCIPQIVNSTGAGGWSPQCN